MKSFVNKQYHGGRWCACGCKEVQRHSIVEFLQVPLLHRVIYWVCTCKLKDVASTTIIMCVWTYHDLSIFYRSKRRVHIDQILAPLALANSLVVWTIFRVPERQLCTTCVLGWFFFACIYHTYISRKSCWQAVIKIARKSSQDSFCWCSFLFWGNSGRC